TLGGFMVAEFGWRSIFLFLTIYALLIAISVSTQLKETKAADRSISLHPRAVVRDYIRILKNPWFLKYSVAGSFAYAGLFAYIAGAAFIYMDDFGFSQQTFGWTFGLNAGGYILGAQINRMFLRKWSSAGVSRSVIQFQTIIALVTVVLYLWLPAGSYVVLGGIWLYLFSLGFITPNTTAQSLAPFSRLAGSASALIGAMQMLFGAMISAIVSLMIGKGSFPVLSVMLLCSLIGSVLLSVSVKRSRMNG